MVGCTVRVGRERGGGDEAGETAQLRPGYSTDSESKAVPEPVQVAGQRP